MDPNLPTSLSTKYPKKKSWKSRIATILLAVTFFILLLYVAYRVLPLIASTSPANSESVSINMLSHGIKTIYAKQKNYNNLSNAMLIQAKMAPDKMISDATTLYNSYAGEVIVEPATLPRNVGATLNNAYKIIYPGIPSKECQQITTNVGNNFEQITINEQIVKEYPNKKELVAEAIQKSCSKEENTLVFYGK